jgi:hypothetical protein
VRTHQEIDQRSLALAQAGVAKIDGDPARAGLERARETCARWHRDNPVPAVAEWLAILKQDLYSTKGLPAVEFGAVRETEAHLDVNTVFCRR